MKTAAPPSSPTNLSKPLPSKEGASPRPHVGTLWTLHRSPFSNAIKIVLALSGRTAKEVSFIPLLSVLTLRLRLGLSSWRRKLTAPILCVSNTGPVVYLTDSLDIASHIDELRDESRMTLFPPEHASRIRKFNRLAATLNSFMRSELIARLRHDIPAAERMFVPRVLRGRVFTGPLVRLGMWAFARKYAEESQEATREKVVAALEAVRDALVNCKGQHLRYTCGARLTYADIILSESLFFDVERHGRWAYLYREEDLAERFPDLVAWARAVRETHFGDVLGARRRRL